MSVPRPHPLRCFVCLVDVSSQRHLDEHERGKAHQKALFRKRVETTFANLDKVGAAHALLACFSSDAFCQLYLKALRFSMS
jgi:hypothetical protein